MIRENGIYVLTGSKPMSSFPIENGTPNSEDELHLAYLDYIAEFPRKIKPSYDSYIRSLEPEPFQNFQKQWEVWRETYANRVDRRYLFGVRRAPFGKGVLQGYFINVPNAIFILFEHYRVFRDIYGKEFDPNNILDEFSSENSEFWDKILKNHYATGLLYGFGNFNSFAFDWEERNFKRADKTDVLSQRIDEESFSILLKKDLRITDLQIPRFGSYRLEDRCLDVYKKERSAIQKEFKRCPFKEKVLDLLLS